MTYCTGKGIQSPKQSLFRQNRNAFTRRCAGPFWSLKRGVQRTKGGFLGGCDFNVLPKMPYLYGYSVIIWCPKEAPTPVFRYFPTKPQCLTTATSDGAAWHPAAATSGAHHRGVVAADPPWPVLRLVRPQHARGARPCRLVHRDL